MFTISGFYKFKKINFLKKHKTYIENEISNTSIRGSIIISSEGINGSLAGISEDIDKILKKTLKSKKAEFINIFVENALKKLNEGGILIIECSSKETLEGFDKIAKFGDTNLLYWKV